MARDKNGYEAMNHSKCIWADIHGFWMKSKMVNSSTEMEYDTKKIEEKKGKKNPEQIHSCWCQHKHGLTVTVA